jgi:hypothetical protein
VKAGIRNRTSDYIVSENSWPLFLYENYSFNANDLERGLFKSKILVQVSIWARSFEYLLKFVIARLSKPYSHLHLLQEKLMEMEMEPISLRITGALDGH